MSKKQNTILCQDAPTKTIHHRKTVLGTQSRTHPLATKLFRGKYGRYNLPHHDSLELILSTGELTLQTKMQESQKPKTVVFPIKKNPSHTIIPTTSQAQSDNQSFTEKALIPVYTKNRNGQISTHVS